MAEVSARSILSVWSSSTRPGPRPTWPPCGAGAVRQQAHSQGPAWPLEDHNFPRRIALRSDRGPMGSRRPDRRRELHNVEKVLLPTLQPGDIVIIDNLGSHKSKAVRALIRSVGATTLFSAEIFARSEPYRAG